MQQQFKENSDRLGNLRDARGLHHRRTLLAVGEARGFILIGVYAPKFFAVSVRHGDQPVMMLATAVFIEVGFVSFCGVLGGAFCHGAFLFLAAVMRTIANKRGMRKWHVR